MTSIPGPAQPREISSFRVQATAREASGAWDLGDRSQACDPLLPGASLSTPTQGPRAIRIPWSLRPTVPKASGKEGFSQELECRAYFTVGLSSSFLASFVLWAQEVC